MLVKTIKDAFYDIKKANKIKDKYVCKGQPYEKYCLACKKKLKATEQLLGFCETCQTKFKE